MMNPEPGGMALSDEDSRLASVVPIVPTGVAFEAAARSLTWSKQRQWLRPALDHDLSRDLDQEDDMSATTTDQHAVTPSDQVKAVDRLVGQMADLSVVDWEAD
jgi:hypothetical protein